jgi:hypothetical protein
MGVFKAQIDKLWDVRVRPVLECDDGLRPRVFYNPRQGVCAFYRPDQHAIYVNAAIYVQSADHRDWLFWLLKVLHELAHAAGFSYHDVEYHNVLAQLTRQVLSFRP